MKGGSELATRNSEKKKGWKERMGGREGGWGRERERKEKKHRQSLLLRKGKPVK